MDKEKIKLDLLKIKLKDLISKKIVDILIKKELPYEKIREMAEDVVDTLRYVTTKEQLLLLVKELPVFYPYLKTESEIMMSELNEIKEQIVINKLQSYLKNLSK